MHRNLIICRCQLRTWINLVVPMSIKKKKKSSIHYPKQTHIVFVRHLKRGRFFLEWGKENIISSVWYERVTQRERVWRCWIVIFSEWVQVQEMPLSVVQITFGSPLQQSILHNLSPSTILPKTLFPAFATEPPSIALRRFIFSTKTSLCARTNTAPTRASLLETPVLWAGRLCIFYALLKAGLAGSQANPLVSGFNLLHLCFALWSFHGLFFFVVLLFFFFFFQFLTVV